MDTFDVIMYALALIFFVLAALNVPVKVNLMACGLAAWVLVPLVHSIKAL